MSLVVNFFGGPSAGKSGVAAAVYAALRKSGHSCELAREAAKDAMWRDDKHTLNNQVLITAIQFDRVLALDGKVDIIVNDSPILTGLVFPTPRGCSPSWRAAVVDQFNEFRNMNFFLKRDPDAGHEQAGRRETADEALAKDAELRGLLESIGVDFMEMQVRRGYDLEDDIVPMVLERLGS